MGAKHRKDPTLEPRCGWRTGWRQITERVSEETRPLVVVRDVPQSSRVVLIKLAVDKSQKSIVIDNCGGTHRPRRPTADRVPVRASVCSRGPEVYWSTSDRFWGLAPAPRTNRPFLTLPSPATRRHTVRAQRRGCGQDQLSIVPKKRAGTMPL